MHPLCLFLIRLQGDPDNGPVDNWSVDNWDNWAGNNWAVISNKNFKDRKHETALVRLVLVVD